MLSNLILKAKVEEGFIRNHCTLLFLIHLSHRKRLGIYVLVFHNGELAFLLVFDCIVMVL